MPPLQNPPAQLPQADLPPISVGRYLDLVRRRRWQVIPVSILGLIIGALVAFVIPRYYVASTSVLYKGYLDPKALTREDPMAGIVAAAEILIPQHVDDAITDLGWEEATGDLAEVMAFEESVRERLVVYDQRREKGVTVAHIVIEYSDTDGQRSADLCNKVRELWIEAEREELQRKASDVMEDLNGRLGAANRELSNATGERSDFESLNRIDSIVVRDPNTGALQSMIQTQLFENRGELMRIDGLLGGLVADFEEKTRRLTAMPRTVPKALAPIEDDLLKQKQVLLSLAVQKLEQSVKEIAKANPDYQNWVNRLEAKRLELEQLQEAAGIGGTSAEQVPNKEWNELQKEVDKLATEINRLRSQKAAIEAENARLEAQREAWPEIMREWEKKRAAVERAEEAVKRIQAQVDEAGAQFDKAFREDPMTVVSEAQVQPAPTDPNIYLVALAGSLVGLGAVVVLILLVDMLQSTFKTVGDVEHALAVPVLGTMAHMESEEVRDEVSRVRRRKMLAAGVALALLITVIAVYYIDPSRLPEPVRQVLSLILTEPGGR